MKDVGFLLVDTAVSSLLASCFPQSLWTQENGRRMKAGEWMADIGCLPFSPERGAGM